MIATHIFVFTFPAFFWLLSTAAPIYVDKNGLPLNRNVYYPVSYVREPGIVGDWISGSNWFPIEINIPDTIGNVQNVIKGVTQQISNAAASWFQRLPFINRKPVQQASPSPQRLQYAILIHPQEELTTKPDLNIFKPSEELLEFP